MRIALYRVPPGEVDVLRQSDALKCHRIDWEVVTDLRAFCGDLVEQSNKGAPTALIANLLGETEPLSTGLALGILATMCRVILLEAAIVVQRPLRTAPNFREAVALVTPLFGSDTWFLERAYYADLFRGGYYRHMFERDPQKSGFQVPPELGELLNIYEAPPPHPRTREQYIAVLPDIRYALHLWDAEYQRLRNLDNFPPSVRPIEALWRRLHPRSYPEDADQADDREEQPSLWRLLPCIHWSSDRPQTRQMCIAIDCPLENFFSAIAALHDPIITLEAARRVFLVSEARAAVLLEE